MSLKDHIFQEGTSGNITIEVKSTKYVPEKWVELAILEIPNLGMTIVIIIVHSLM